MARRSRMFKQIALVKTEDLGSAGGVFNIAKIMKQVPTMSSCYVKNVQISCIVNDVAGGGTPASDMPLNFMVYATTDTGTPAGDNTLTGRATGYGGGHVNLAINRVIRSDDYDKDSGDGAILIQAEATDATITADVDVKFVIEVWGKWHQIVSA